MAVSAESLPASARRSERGRQPPSLAATIPNIELTLLDLADRLLDRGVVLAGEATLSVAGVDLVYLGLNAALGSVETLQRSSRQRGRAPAGSSQPGVSASSAMTVEAQPLPEQRRSAAGAPANAAPLRAAAEAMVAPSQLHDDVASLAAAEAEVERLQSVLPERVEIDPEGVEHGLAKLVLTLVEFIRQLLERQAVRRMEGGGLAEEQVERMGLALQRLEARMEELCRAFEINPDELNINLGPLGNLI